MLNFQLSVRVNDSVKLAWYPGSIWPGESGRQFPSRLRLKIVFDSLRGTRFEFRRGFRVFSSIICFPKCIVIFLNKLIAHWERWHATCS